MTFTLLLFDSGVCLPFNNRNELDLKRSQIPRKIQYELKQVFHEKKTKNKIATYISDKHFDLLHLQSDEKREAKEVVSLQEQVKLYQLKEELRDQV